MIYLKRLGLLIAWPVLWLLPGLLFLITALPAYIATGDTFAWSAWLFDACEPYVWGRR